jgi:cytochrome c-type biogenesis protein CcmH/NrfG
MRALALAEQRGDWAEVAAIAEHDLMDRHKAIHAWRHVLERDPSDLATHHELARLYKVDQRWQELADTLEHQLELVGNPEARRTLLGELVAVYRDQLGDAARAEQLERVLGEL